jgi:mRNA-degrading endonuclease HigB of HigAB toxin-antitoxin module
VQNFADEVEKVLNQIAENPDLLQGNDYRLIADIEYKLKIVFIVWFGR